jgi:hypothetical protein
MRRTSFRNYYQVQKLTLAHLPTSCTRMPAERKGERFQRLHIDQGSTEYEPHCRSWYNHVRRGPPQSVMASCQSPQFCSQIPPRGGNAGRLVHRCLPSTRMFALRGRRSFGRPRAPLVLPIGTPPGTDSNPSPLGTQPLSGRAGPERGAPPGQPRRKQKSGTSCSGRLPR